MTAVKTPVQGHKVVSNDEWTEARKAFLAREKEFTRQRDELSKQRRELPWTRVEKNYTFEGPDGKRTLADLFDGRSQLIVYHFMLGPGWGEGCKSCSYLSDHFDGAVPHLKARDVTLAVVSRAPIAEIEAFKKRMGWRFNWVSSYDSDFNYDYHVSFTKDKTENGKVYYNYELQEFGSEEGPGVSVFYKDENGDIFHTYSAYARGLDILVGTYNFLDLAPKGRDEDALPFTMSWVRHHDKYEDNSPKAIGIDRKPVVFLEQPRFENAGPIFIAGIERRYNCGEANDIPGQWGSFAPHIGKIPGQAGHVTYGVCTGEGDVFHYMTGVEVTDLSGLPDDFTGIRVPAQKYAVFTHRGVVSNIAQTLGAIWSEWLPGSGQEPTHSPGFFERYDERFDPKTGRGEVEIWVPIKA